MTHYPQCPPEAWMKRYPELSVQNKPCDACGVQMQARPVVFDGHVGLEGWCPCRKNKRKWITAVTVTGEAYNEWMEAVGSFDE